MLVCDCSAFAQTVTLNGRIVDSCSGEVLPYAALYVPNRRTGTLANADGVLQRLNTGYRLNRLLIQVANRSYLVSYQLQAGRWVMHHAQSKSTYRYYPINTIINTQMDLVVTKTTDDDVKRFPHRERLNLNQAFAEEIRDFDDSFWGDENTLAEEK